MHRVHPSCTAVQATWLTRFWVEHGACAIIHAGHVQPGPSWLLIATKFGFTGIFAAQIMGWAGPTASQTLLHVLRYAGDGTLSQATGSCSLLHVHCCAGDFANQIADGAGVKELYMRAGELYMEASRAPAAAQALSKGAKILEEKDPQVITGLWAGVGQCGGRDAVQGGQSELLGWRWWCPWHAASHLQVRRGCEVVSAARGGTAVCQPPVAAPTLFEGLQVRAMPMACFKGVVWGRHLCREPLAS